MREISRREALIYITGATIAAAAGVAISQFPINFDSSQDSESKAILDNTKNEERLREMQTEYNKTHDHR